MADRTVLTGRTEEDHPADEGLTKTRCVGPVVPGRSTVGIILQGDVGPVSVLPPTDDPSSEGPYRGLVPKN